MEINRPVTIEFNYYNDDNEFDDNVDLTFRTTPNMTIGTLHSFCKIFAVALGFSHEQVDKAFGRDIEDRI